MKFQILRDSDRAAGMIDLLETERENVHASSATTAGQAGMARLPKTRSLRFLLKQFDFDACENRPELNRINNMTWEFMQVDGLYFHEALTLAAEIVVHCEVAACEAGYVDARMLWERINRPVT